MIDRDLQMQLLFERNRLLTVKGARARKFLRYYNVAYYSIAGVEFLLENRANRDGIIKVALFKGDTYRPIGGASDRIPDNKYTTKKLAYACLSLLLSAHLKKEI